MRETHSRASCRQHLLVEVWPKRTGAPSPRRQLPTRASPQAFARSQSRTHTNTRVVHTDTHKGKDSEENPRRRHRRLSWQARLSRSHTQRPAQGRCTRPPTFPEASWPSGTSWACTRKQVVFKTRLHKTPPSEASCVAGPLGSRPLYSACEGSRPSQRRCVPT